MNPDQQQGNQALLEQATDELRNRARRIQGSVSANDLVNPTPRVNVPEPAQPEPVGNDALLRNVQNSLTFDINEFRQNQAERQRLLEEQRALAGEGSLSELFNQQQEEFQIPQNLRQLQDIQLQLADLGTESLQTRSDIARAAGQTVGQGSREISAEQARNNVRSYGLAAQAAVLQGNIQTAQAAVQQAMNIAYQDRQLRNQNLINQINAVQAVVSEQRGEILEQEKRRYEEDQAKIQRVQTAVDNALLNGATQNEVAMLTDINTTDDKRLALAQLIQARGAKEMRDLQMQSAQLDVAVKAEQLSKLRNPVVATRDTSVIEVGDQKQLVDTQTGEVIATFGADVSSDDIQQARDVNYVNTVDALKTHPGLNTSVGPTGLTRIAGIDAFGNKDDFISSMENILKKLTMQTYEEAKAAGATFGAMQQAEWDMLAEAATKISQTRVYEKEGFPGFRSSTSNVKGYDIAENDFLKELDLISNFGKMNAVRNGADPAEMGIKVEDDGMYSTFNHDGSVTQFRISENNLISVQ